MAGPGFWRGFDEAVPRILAIAAVLIVLWLILPFPKFHVSVQAPPQPAPVVRVVVAPNPAAAGPQAAAPAAAPAVTTPASAPAKRNWNFWPPFPVAVVIGVTIVALTAMRRFKSTAEAAAKAPAAGAATGLTVLGVLTAALPQFEDKLGDQSYLLAVIAGAIAITPMVGRAFTRVWQKALAIVLVLTVMGAGFALVFSQHYALGAEDPKTHVKAVISGWEWLLSDLGTVTPGIWASLVIMLVAFLLNVTVTFLKPRP